VKDIYSVKEVAAFLGLHPNTVYRSIGKGELRALRINKSLRILSEDLQEYLNICRTDTAETGR
jgi:excisionase family DNA binding protein